SANSLARVDAISTSWVMRDGVTYAFTACAPYSTASSRPRRNSSTASWMIANGCGSRMANSRKLNAPSPNMNPILYFSSVHVAVGLHLGTSKQPDSLWHHALQECFSMFLIPQVHLKRDPFIILVTHGHFPRTCYVLRELPENVITILVGKALVVCLAD